MAPSLRKLSLLSLGLYCLHACASASTSNATHVSLLILGGGMTGLTAATTLSSTYNLSSYLLLEGSPLLGGRMRSTTFGSQSSPGGQHVIELGANWVQGLSNPDTGVTNPIWTLAQTYNLSTTYSNYSDFLPYTSNGTLDVDDVNDVFDDWGDAFETFLAGAGERQERGLHDLSARAGVRIGGWNPTDFVQRAVEFWNFDMEYAMIPDESSWIEVANNNNFTFNQFSEDNNLVIDPRGFSTLATAPFYSLPASQRGQVELNATVASIAYSSTGVSVTLSDNRTITADYALCTFSLGVLQSSSITFTPALPGWKQIAISGFAMSTYTKLFIQFSTKFWPDTQFQLYADPFRRGYYTQWQSLDAPGFLPGSRILFTTVTNEGSVRVESMSDAAVLAELLAVLGGMYGADVVHAANVTDFYFPRWHADPLFRGTYSNWPAAYHPAMLDNLRAALPGSEPAASTSSGPSTGTSTGAGRLLFAGEATSYEYFGFLQGAYTEGERAAHALAGCLVGPSKGKEGCLGQVRWGEVREGYGEDPTFL